MKQSPSEQNALHFRMDVAEKIAKAMHRQEINRTKLAGLLGCSKANVTKILSGDENLTLDTLSKVLEVLKARMDVLISPDAADEWDVKRKLARIEDAIWNENQVAIFTYVQVTIPDDAASAGSCEIESIAA